MPFHSHPNLNTFHSGGRQGGGGENKKKKKKKRSSGLTFKSTIYSGEFIFFFVFIIQQQLRQQINLWITAMLTTKYTFFKVLLFLHVISDSSVKKMCVFLLFLGLRISKNLDLSFAFFSKYCTLRWVKSGIPSYLKIDR